VEHNYLATLQVKPTPEDQIKAAQKENMEILKIKEKIKCGSAPSFSEDKEGVVWFGKCFVVPKKQDLKYLILHEAHDMPLSIHPGSTKMYHDLLQRFWWICMEWEIARFVAEYDTCHRVKAEYQRPAGMLQPLPIPQWKCDEVGIDFITSLLRSPKGNDAICVVVDRLSKVAHLLLVKTTKPIG
jgi:hypothetical protein